MRYSGVVSALRAPILIALAVTVSVLAPHSKAQIIQDGNFPAVVCPGALGGGTQQISLPAKGLGARSINGKSEIFKVQKSMILAGTLAPTFISGNRGSEIAFQSISGSSSADAVCQVGGVDQWFIGGSGGVTSQGILQIINSGLSESLVQIFPYNSKGALAPIAITVKGNSLRNFSLASVVPGEDSVALHIVTDSGRVSTFLLDHRRNGLRDLGASFVTPVSAPATTSYISGLLGSAAKAVSTMRFLVPGNLSAHVHLSIYSNGGAITPIGFDSLLVARQRVLDVAIPPIVVAGTYGIEVTSDQPIFASTLTSFAGTDFSWANQLTPLSSFNINLAGAHAQFFFMGDAIAIRLQWVDSKGKPNNEIISGHSAALFRPQGALNGVTFTTLTKSPIFGGMIVANPNGGLNYLPLLANRLISRARSPNSDLRTLARQ